MTCTHLPHADGEPCVIVCGPRNVEVLREEDAGVRWCFRCRAHLPHTDRLFAEPPGSYYDPWWSRQCSRCGEDHTAFPGTKW